MAKPASSRELEKRGIGRPSTYASIISTIQDRGYARLENKRFYAEKMGDIVTERLQKSFTELLDYGFTASMEGTSGRGGTGQAWTGGELLDQFYAEFSGLLEKAGEPEPAGMQLNEPTMTDIECSNCGRDMQISHCQYRRIPGLLGLRPAAERALQADD